MVNYMIDHILRRDNLLKLIIKDYAEDKLGGGHSRMRIYTTNSYEHENEKLPRVEQF